MVVQDEEETSMRPTVQSVLGVLSNQIQLKAISVFLALLLWFVVLGSRTSDITREVPIEYTVAKGTVFAELPPDRLVVRVQGPKAFLRGVASRLEEPLVINLKDRRVGNHLLRFTPEMLNIPTGVKVVSLNPPQVVFRLEELKKKLVPASVEVAGLIPEGNKLVRTELQPSSVRIRGARSKLANIHQLVSMPIDLSTVLESGPVPLNFDLEALGIDVDGPIPEAWLEVEGEGALSKLRSIPIRPQGSNKYSLSERTSTLMIRNEGGGRMDLSMVQATIDLAGLAPGEYLRYLHVTLPPGVRLVRAFPQIVKVVIPE
jgi:YbbR domain-containing protein